MKKLNLPKNSQSTIKRGLLFLLLLILLFFSYRIVSKKTGFKISKIFRSKTDEDILNRTSIKVNAYPVEEKKVSSNVTALGSIEYYEKVDIVSKTSGRIEGVFVREGQIVKKKQLLVQIEKLQLQLDLKKNESQLNSALSGLKLAQEKYDKAKKQVEMRLITIDKNETEVKRLKAELDRIRTTYQGKKALYKRDGVSKEELENTKVAVVNSEAKFLSAKKDFEIAQIGYRQKDLKKVGLQYSGNREQDLAAYIAANTRIEKAEVNAAAAGVQAAQTLVDSTKVLLKQTAIRSPIDGIIAMRNKNVGDYVNQGGVSSSEQAILAIVAIHKVYATLNIRESELKDIKEGLNLEFSVDVYPDKVFTGPVTIINPLVDQKTHTVEVKALIGNKENLLKPGMFIRGKIVNDQSRVAILIPQKAIIPIDEKRADVFIINTRAKPKTVLKSGIQIGKQFDDMIEVTNGLKTGMMIATEKFAQLKDGTKVIPNLSSSGK